MFVPFLLFVFLFEFGSSINHDDSLPKAFNSIKIRKFNKNRLIIQRLKIGANTKFVGTSENCPKFMNFTACACEPTCETSEPICINCQPGCVCRNGFVRNAQFQCVFAEECPNFKIQKIEPKYEAEPITQIIRLTKKPVEINTTTVPLVIFRNGPTPPPSPPMLNPPSMTDVDLIGAPSATPPPDFGPPGMSASRMNEYEKYIREKRVLRALKKRTTRRI